MGSEAELVAPPAGGETRFDPDQNRFEFGLKTVVRVFASLFQLPADEKMKK